MEKELTQAEDAAGKVYDYTANLLINEKKTEAEAEVILIEQGIDAANAKSIVQNLSAQISLAKKERAKKDMLYGALWCVGGIIATSANIGFIFWGAIVFGAIQFFKGAINS